MLIILKKKRNNKIYIILKIKQYNIKNADKRKIYSKLYYINKENNKKNDMLEMLVCI